MKTAFALSLVILLITSPASAQTTSMIQDITDEMTDERQLSLIIRTIEEEAGNHMVIFICDKGSVGVGVQSGEVVQFTWTQ